ncbi:hypothetical protein M758_1G129900 [Ceratodon purpureus]|uniref:Uncharacterized protein n=1 Tax=Ceratodon purpureus TaxID=3225 RepID=A0A8T0J6S4_CERPU|nr:hypothetical protein KC19_1G135100 [Ceratodon purpureus]KAG0629784.1 hypothetical protein M758_1G129900 [Ceratodon purpureus]
MGLVLRVRGCHIRLYFLMGGDKAPFNWKDYILLGIHPMFRKVKSWQIRHWRVLRHCITFRVAVLLYRSTSATVVYLVEQFCEAHAELTAMFKWSSHMSTK